MKVQLENRAGNTVIVEMPITTKLTNHFTLRELANNNGNPAKPQYVINWRVDVHNYLLEKFRVKYGKPMNPTSGYRQPEYNKSVGGTNGSAHTYGCATDVWIINCTDAQIKNICNSWKSICESAGIIGAINIYTHGFHFETFSDAWYNSKCFAVRDYRGRKGDW